MRRNPAGQASTSRRGRRWYGLPKRRMEDGLTVKITYRGGAEAWWLVEARGRSGVFPGHLCIHDVMREVCRQWEPGGEG